MLYLLTGDVQTGKTRWLQQHVERLRTEGITCYGVIAPGDWVESKGPHANADGFEKRGIWNVLLPQGERIRFADRKDIALEQDTFEEGSEAGRIGLGWHISDEALAQVNQHLANLPEAPGKGLLVIDELGRLELVHDCGLTEAVRLLKAGPTAQYQDTLVVARDRLAHLVEEMFADIWGGCERIEPAL